MMLMSRAAATYCSMCVGVTRNTSATLSKPSLAMSAGSIERASMCTPSSCSTAAAYSVRFMRCSATRPGSGPRAAAVASRCRSSAVTSARRSSASGRGSPGGGIKPPRSLRITCSNTSGLAATLAGVTCSSDMSPAASASLWQSVQYLPNSSMCCATASSGGGSEQPASRAMIKAVAAPNARFAWSLRLERVTEPPCPPKPVVDVRDEAFAVVAPRRVELFRHVGSEHLVDAAALAHQVLDALAHDGQHFELGLKMRARLRRPGRGHDQRVRIRQCEKLLRPFDEPADPTA